MNKHTEKLLAGVAMSGMVAASMVLMVILTF